MVYIQVKKMPTLYKSILLEIEIYYLYCQNNQEYIQQKEATKKTVKKELRLREALLV